MAVYTAITLDELNLLLADYDLGTAVALKGIQGGIENTNYFVTLEHQGTTTDYVLTIFEELSKDELPYFIHFGQSLDAKGVAVPYGIKNREGKAQLDIQGKPAMLQPKFSGAHLDKDTITPAHCAEIAEGLARFHIAAQDFPEQRQAHRGVLWWREYGPQSAAKLPAADGKLLLDEVAKFDWLREQDFDLPVTTMHGDLFHDNALFIGDKLSAILDIYNAATGYMLYDLAIVANDWCSDSEGKIDAAREQALLAAYHPVRPFTQDEKAVWPTLVRTAAMRFWLSRLIPTLDIGQSMRASGEIKILDPDAMKRILQYRVDHPAEILLDI